jgi:hypothetical protein
MIYFSEKRTRHTLAGPGVAVLGLCGAAGTTDVHMRRLD